MDQETAYKVLMRFATGPRLQAWMQKTLDGGWDVTVKTPTRGLRTLSTLEQAFALGRQLKSDREQSAAMGCQRAAGRGGLRGGGEAG
jgi:hypothetical protein